MGGVKVVFPREVEKKITTSSMLPHFDLAVDFSKDNRQLIFECDMRHVNKTDSEIQIGAAFENMDNLLLIRTIVCFNVFTTDNQIRLLANQIIP